MRVITVITATCPSISFLVRMAVGALRAARALVVVFLKVGVRAERRRTSNEDELFFFSFVYIIVVLSGRKKKPTKNKSLTFHYFRAETKEIWNGIKERTADAHHTMSTSVFLRPARVLVA